MGTADPVRLARPARAIAAREIAALALLGLTIALLFADQNLMAPNLTQIANEFGFSAVERDAKLGGHTSLAFWMLGAIASILIGTLTDRMPRKWLFVGVMLIGEIPCLLTGFTRNYEELFWARALTGLGLGGALPLVYSLLGDYFSARARAAATAITGFAMGIGIAAGQVLASMIGPTLGWRLPFILVAAPNLVLIGVLAAVMREPARGGTEEALKELVERGEVYAERVDWARWKAIFRTRTNALVFLQGLPGTVPWGIFFTFLNDFYAQDKGYSVERAVLLVMAIGVGALAGGLVGGLWGNRLYNRNPAYLPILSGVTALLGIPPTLVLINLPAHAGGGAPPMALPLVLSLVTGFVISIPSSNVKAMLINVNAPEIRGSVFSLYNLADDLGRGLGPWVIGSLLVPALGRTAAFSVAACFWIACGVVLLATARAFPRDERALQEALRAKMGAATVTTTGTATAEAQFARVS